MLIAEIIVYAFFAYAAAGVLFASWFAFSGAARLDDAARDAGYGFRFVVFFGAAALWIFLIGRRGARVRETRK